MSKEEVHQLMIEEATPLSQPLETETGGEHFTDNVYNTEYTVWSKCLPKQWVDYLFPTNQPRSVQLLRKENLAVPACYLCVGLLQGLSGPFINVYPQFIGATEAQQATISAIRGLPASFKLFFGFWSDNIPFFGYRRKSYMFIGWAISSLSMLFLVMTSDLVRIEVDDNDNRNNYDNGSSSFIPSENAPSIQILTLAFLIFGIGFWFADVMGDSIVAEKAKLEPEHSRGHLQSTCYACRFFGLMVAAPISTYLYSTVGPQIVIKLMCILPLVMLIPIYNLYEAKNAPITSTSEQCNEIWKTVCSRAVWQPMGFVYIYNVLQIGNAAWREFLLSVLKFQDWQLNILLVVAHVLLYVGVMAYKVSLLCL
jgi:MFS family permease